MGKACVALQNICFSTYNLDRQAKVKRNAIELLMEVRYCIKIETLLLPPT